MPWATQVLSKYTEATRDLAIKSRILGTPGVTSIVYYSVSLDRFSRKFNGSITIDTAYGQTTVQLPVTILPPPSFGGLGRDPLGEFPLGS